MNAEERAKKKEELRQDMVAEYENGRPYEAKAIADEIDKIDKDMFEEKWSAERLARMDKALTDIDTSADVALNLIEGVNDAIWEAGMIRDRKALKATLRGLAMVISAIQGNIRHISECVNDGLTVPEAVQE